MTVKEGWTGRTITDTDNIWFTLLTCNPDPIHFDANYAAKTEWGPPPRRFYLHAGTGNRPVGV